MIGQEVNAVSKYTTGEMAKLCGVSVRTVQYYDARGILIPTMLSEGGRRLYSEEDLKKLKIICFLRELDLPINSIGQLFSEDDPGSVISILLEQQTGELRTELEQTREKLARLELLRREVKTVEHFSVESIGDIAYMMENRKKLNRVRGMMLTGAVAAELIETGTLLLWIFRGIWWPFAAGLPVVIALNVWVIRFYFKKVKFLCPKCHSIFRPRFWEMFWANHTVSTRKLTCPCCGRKGFCVEVYGGDGQ